MNPGEGFPADVDPCPIAIVKDVQHNNEVEACDREGLCNQHKDNNQVKDKMLHKLKVYVQHTLLEDQHTDLEGVEGEAEPVV